MTTALAFSLAFEADLRAMDRRGRHALAVRPPSGTVLAVVRQFGEGVERDDGLTLYRLTPMQLADPDIRVMLGDEAERAGDVSVLWDDREAELVRVQDAAALRDPGSSLLTYADFKVRADRGRARRPHAAAAA